VLVTGGAGFIGSHLTDHLLARGDHICVVDNLSTGRRANLPAGGAGLRFIESDLAAALAGPLAKEHFDEVYHLAAAVGVRLVIEQPIRAIETNVDQTAALLRFVASMERPCPVLIASSSEVYGKSSKSPFSEDDDVVYGPTTATRWSYACAKAIDEFLALAYHAQRGVPCVIARFFNTVGPRQVGEYGMVLPRFVRAVMEGRSPEVFGDGSASRCFCDVRDVVRALPRMLGEPRCHGRVFNLGSDRPITIAALAELVARTLGVRVVPTRVPYAEAYPPGFEDLRQRQPDLRRVREAVGFQQSIPLEQTIRDVADEIRGGQGRA
jgi:UDP-glucose 4-epimerase